jgi:predicted ester cyclase
MTTTAISSKQLIVEYLQALSSNPRTEELIDKYVADPTLKTHIFEFDAGFPGYQLVPEQLIAEGDLVAFVGKFQGTHRGIFFGIEPTGKEVNEDIAVFYRVEDQKITWHKALGDQTKVLAELRG